MLLPKLAKALENEPNYRLQQANDWLFKKLINSWDLAKNLSPDLQKKLKQNLDLDIPANLYLAKNKKSAKALIKLSDGQKTETVLIKNHDDRYTVCLSSQVGCPLGCSFCATGQMGFKRNLEVEEIVWQVLYWARYLKAKNDRIDNLVFMGQGEPLLNYDNVMQAIKIINDREGLNIGARKISISTIGIPEGINKLAKEKLQVNLAWSLHAPTNRLRSKIMRINNTYDIEEVLKSLDAYVKQSGRKLMIEYLLLDQVNDDKTSAQELSALFKNRQLYLINLIPYNPTSAKYRASLPASVKEFTAILEKNKIHFNVRHSLGQELFAACGQLANSKI